MMELWKNTNGQWHTTECYPQVLNYLYKQLQIDLNAKSLILAPGITPIISGEFALVIYNY